MFLVCLESVKEQWIVSYYIDKVMTVKRNGTGFIVGVAVYGHQSRRFLLRFCSDVKEDVRVKMPTNYLTRFTILNIVPRI